MAALFSLIPLPYKIAAALALIAAIWAGIELHDHNERQKGYTEALQNFEKATENSLKNKAKNDDELQGKSIDDLVDELWIGGLSNQ